MVNLGHIRWGNCAELKWGECSLSVFVFVVKVSESNGGVVTIEDMEVENVEVEVYYGLITFDADCAFKGCGMWI